MQGNFNQNIPYPNYAYPQQNAQSPNAVSINIYSPQAYGTPQNASAQGGNYCPIYAPDGQGGFIYPPNYNNMFNPYAQNPMYDPRYQYPPQQNPMYDPNNPYPGQQNPNMIDNSRNLINNPEGLQKTPQNENALQNDNTTDSANNANNTNANSQDDETKVVTPLTDEYVKSLENYLNDSNPKIRLIGAKELMERFKEDDNRKDNKSLIPLLNKTLRDTSAAVRFLGLTTLQLGYSVGNDETVQILKEIQTQNKDTTGEDNLLASEILLKMASPQQVEIKG